MISSRSVLGALFIAASSAALSACGSDPADQQEGQLVDGKPPPIDVAVNAAANHCEIYVDSFAIEDISAYYHAGETNLFFELATRPKDDVIDTGILARVDETVKVTSESGPVTSQHSDVDLLYAYDERSGNRFTG